MIKSGLKVAEAAGRDEEVGFMEESIYSGGGRRVELKR